MKRAWALLGSAVFLVIAPGTLAGYIPWTFTRWQMRAPFFPFARAVGVMEIFLGLPVLLDSFARFALQGFGTPAPVAPPSRLVVSGLYRYVRNPMYVAVMLIILGQAMLFGDVRLIYYGAAVALGFHLFVLLYEEPALRAKFGDDYADYCRHVPRWRIRFRPYTQP